METGKEVGATETEMVDTEEEVAGVVVAADMEVEVAGAIAVAEVVEALFVLRKPRPSKNIYYVPF